MVFHFKAASNIIVRLIHKKPVIYEIFNPVAVILAVKTRLSPLFHLILERSKNEKSRPSSECGGKIV